MRCFLVATAAYFSGVLAALNDTATWEYVVACLLMLGVAYTSHSIDKRLRAHA